MVFSTSTYVVKLISGLNTPWGIAVSGSDLFVANFGSGTIGEYTTSGATVNASLISGLAGPEAVAVSGPYLFVGDGSHIGIYTTSGATVDASVISGLHGGAMGIAVTTSPIPEPGGLSLTLFGLCLAAAGSCWRKRKGNCGQ